MNPLRELQDWLRSSKLSALVIPSTDEFLSEFSPPANRRLRWATGFSGSTGLAVITQDAAALFLDGRYRLGGTEGVERAGLAIEDATLASRKSWLKRSLPSGAKIGIDYWLHGATDVAQWQALCAELGFELERLGESPIDQLWRADRPRPHRPSIVDYSVQYAGESHVTKCAELIEHVRSSGRSGLLVADPEDVSWLLNVRAADATLRTPVGGWHIVPSCPSRALVRKEGHIVWFVDQGQLTGEAAARRAPPVSIAPPEALPQMLAELAREGPIAADPRRTPAALAAIIECEGLLVADDTVARSRWRKHSNEIAGARRAHLIDAVAVVRLMAWIARTAPQRTISEFEAAEQLEVFRLENPNYKGPSEPSMSASGPHGAQPHYVPQREGSRALNDHPMYWMDSGGQYPGGSTDNTFTLALGPPEPKHIQAHTVVLKAFIALATARVPRGAYGIHLDMFARQALWREGIDCAHGTGHGVGNYLNIHEGPGLSREATPLSTAPIEPGMIITNEPGYYAAGDFGVRIESHLLVVASSLPGFLEFETISRLPIDPRLVDFERLSSGEQQWLADYHRIVLRDLEPNLDDASGVWLRELVGAFTRAVL